MTTRRCGRCDWTGDDDEATEHARESGHLLCIVCQHRSLTVHETQTCASCVGRVRVDLADILDGYASLEPAGVDALTLLGDGTMQRHAHRYELESGVRDEWWADPLPVVAALASWEDFWRSDYGDPVGSKATLTGVVGYLRANLDTGYRAAQTHSAFDEFAADVRRLRSAVQHTAGLADIPVEAKASCFDCGGELLRTYRPPQRPLDERRRQARRRAMDVLRAVRDQREAETSYGVRRHDLTPWPLGTARRSARLALVGDDGDGLVDEWTCGWCRREYDQAGYFLALRAAASSWVNVPLAAETAGRSVWTVRSWVRRLLVGSACRVSDRAVLVWWPDVSDRAFRHADDAESQRTA